MWWCLKNAMLSGRPSHRGADRNNARPAFVKGVAVAPHTGARIETLFFRPSSGQSPGRPSHRGADRNMQCCSVRGGLFFVAPHTGARIETSTEPQYERRPAVAPHTGARIETTGMVELLAIIRVAPHTGARIETRQQEYLARGYSVAPHTGARIETRCATDQRVTVPSRPSHRGADRNLQKRTARILGPGRPSHRGADRNIRFEIFLSLPGRSPLTQGRGSKHGASLRLCMLHCRPSHRGADRNHIFR